MSWKKLAEAELAYTGNDKTSGFGFDLSVSNFAFNNGYYLLIQTACILDSSLLLFKHLENQPTNQPQF